MPVSCVERAIISSQKAEQGGSSKSPLAGRKGMDADLVVLRGDPEEDVTSFAKGATRYDLEKSSILAIEILRS